MAIQMQLLDRMHNCVMANIRFGSASGRSGSTSVGRERERKKTIFRDHVTKFTENWSMYLQRVKCSDSERNTHLNG